MSDEIKNTSELTEQKLDEVVGGDIAKLVDKASPKVADELPSAALDEVVGGVAALPPLHKYTNITLKRG